MQTIIDAAVDVKCFTVNSVVGFENDLLNIHRLFVKCVLNNSGFQQFKGD